VIKAEARAQGISEGQLWDAYYRNASRTGNALLDAGYGFGYDAQADTPASVQQVTPAEIQMRERAEVIQKADPSLRPDQCETRAWMEQNGRLALLDEQQRNKGIFVDSYAPVHKSFTPIEATTLAGPPMSAREIAEAAIRKARANKLKGGMGPSIQNNNNGEDPNRDNSEDTYFDEATGQLRTRDDDGNGNGNANTDDDDDDQAEARYKRKRKLAKRLKRLRAERDALKGALIASKGSPDKEDKKDKTAQLKAECGPVGKAGRADAQTCSSCGVTRPDGDRFCSNCGAPLAGIVRVGL
jgi:hypothetical protein